MNARTTSVEGLVDRFDGSAFDAPRGRARIRLIGLERLRFQRVDTAFGQLSVLTAGARERAVPIHGLGATKGSFLPTVAALAGSFRTIALDPITGTCPS